MDALPGVGHACGHNLIAISGNLSFFRFFVYVSNTSFQGVGVAIAIKAALEKFDIAGKVTLLGTPGKINRRFWR